MKKILALILAILMLTVTLVGCNNTPLGPIESDTDTSAPDTDAPDTNPSDTEASDTEPGDTEPPVESDKKLEVGFSKVSITPDGSYDVPLAGSGDGMQRLTTNVMDDVYATAVAFRDMNGNLAVLISIDVLHITKGTDGKIYDNLIRQIKQIDGLDESNVIISATHTHSSVDIFSSYNNIKMKYLPFFYKAVRQAATDAVADLAPADIYIGAAEIKNMAFVRRYFAADGSFVGTQWANDAEPVRHETDADSMMQLVKVEREGKRDLVLTNWAVHLTTVSEQKQISADFVSYFRNWMDKNADTDVVFFQGASGNTVPSSRLEGEDYGLDTESYGQMLAQKLHNELRKEDTLKKIDTNVEIKMNSDTLGLVYNHAKIAGYSQETINQCITIAEDFYSAKITAGEANKRARELGFSSVYECGTVRSLAKFHNFETERVVDFWAISMGELSFASAPYEMFCQTGTQIREGDKATTTFVVTHANGSNGYIPTEDVWDNGGYESVTCPFEKGTAERIAEKLIEMVNKNYK